MSDMKEYLPEVDEEKLKCVLEVKDKYYSGQISLEEAQKILKEKVKILRPYEIALAEQKLRQFDPNECKKEDIQQMMLLFDNVMDKSRPQLDREHPIMCYIRENDEMRKILEEIKYKVNKEYIKNEWLDIYDRLHEWRKHLSRKQNQLYSILEQKGFDRPTTTMWVLDDFIRDEISEVRQLAENNEINEFLSKQNMIIEDILDLMEKEENVLYPTSLAMINNEEFEDMKIGDSEIGYAYITVNKPNIENNYDSTNNIENEDIAKDLANLLNKYGYKISDDKKLNVATGELTLEQINLIYKHMPVDLSFVDEHNIVKFYTDTEHRVFPRSKNVIGRRVENCHPQKSLDKVLEIIDKFRDGSQNEIDFWINKPDIFIYIKYVAIRDENNKFRGVLEMMQDCTHIRSLEGSRTLVNWNKGNIGDTKIDEKKEILNNNDSDINEITGDTMLKDLLNKYPFLRDELPKIHFMFKAIKTPLARIMLPKATVKMMSERSGMQLDVLINKLNDIIKKMG